MTRCASSGPAAAGANPPISNTWLRVYEQQTGARLRLFCFHFAGGGASMFRRWAPALGPAIEVVAVQLPGREWRIAEPPFRQLGPLLPELIDMLAPHLDKNYVFFGHSMGALVSFELIREIRRNGLRQPLLYVASGRGPPHLPDNDAPIHHLPDPEFIAALEQDSQKALAPILADEELKSLVLPVLRADYELCESYEYAPNAPLECPIVVFGGENDSSVDEQELLAWREQTTGSCRYYRFPGDHFFVRSEEVQVLSSLREELRALASGAK